MTNEWFAVIIGASTLASVVSTVVEVRLGRLRNTRIDLLEKRIDAGRSNSSTYVIDVKVNGLEDVEALRTAIASVMKEAADG